MRRLFKIISEVYMTYVAIMLILLGVIVIVTHPMLAIPIIISAMLCILNNPFNERTVYIKYFDEDILKPIEKIKVGDWIDLRAAETVSLNAGDLYPIRLGVGMILPEGYEAYVLPRSSTPNTFGITMANNMGIIDNSYSGDADEWHFLAVALRDTIIHKNDRIAQFRIMKNQPSIHFEIVDRLKVKSRGGFGSTGRL